MFLNRRFAFAFTALVASLNAASAHAGEAYANIGLPGLMLGYGHSLDQSWGVRADYATLGGGFDRDFTESGIQYKGRITAQRLGLFADYFPMQGGFRLTGGVTFNDMNIRLRSRFDGTTSVTVGGKTVTPTAGDYFNIDVKFPRTTPYLGIGWGHQPGAQGLGFVADLGLMIGKAKVITSQNVVANHPGVVTQADVDAETQKLRERDADIRYIPQVSVGLNYRY